MAIATPMNSAYVPNSIFTRPGSSLNRWYRPYAIPQPKPKGRAIPAAPTLSAIRQLERRRRRSTSSPTRKRKSMRPTLAAIDNVGMEAVGKMASVKPGTRPNTEGPRRIPPMTSAMTRGWRNLERGKWRRRQKTMMMPACEIVSWRVLGTAGAGLATWMMKRMMGFLGSYLEGFWPWRMPPWFAALAMLAMMSSTTSPRGRVGWEERAAKGRGGSVEVAKA